MVQNIQIVPYFSQILFLSGCNLSHGILQTLLMRLSLIKILTQYKLMDPGGHMVAKFVTIFQWLNLQLMIHQVSGSAVAMFTELKIENIEFEMKYGR